MTRYCVCVCDRLFGAKWNLNYGENCKGAILVAQIIKNIHGIILITTISVGN